MAILDIITTGGSLYRRACVLSVVVAGPGGELGDDGGA